MKPKCVRISPDFVTLWVLLQGRFPSQKMKFSIKDFFRKCDQIHSFLWSCSIAILLLLPKFSCFRKQISAITEVHSTKKWSSPSRIFSVNVTKSEGTADLVTFTEEILNGKLDFFCSGWWVLRKLGLIARAIEGALIKLHFHYTSLFVSATRRRKYIKIPLCLSGPVRKS